MENDGYAGREGHGMVSSETYAHGCVDDSTVLSSKQAKLLKCLGRILDNRLQHDIVQDRENTASSSPSSSLRRRRSTEEWQSRASLSDDATSSSYSKKESYTLTRSEFDVLLSTTLSMINNPVAHREADGRAMARSSMRRGRVPLEDDREQPAEDVNTTEQTDTPSGGTPDGKSFQAREIAELPEETLARIFQYARQATEEEWDVTKVAREQASRQDSWGGPPPKQPQSPYQIWILSLRLVCKAWSPVVQSVAWNHVRTPNRRLLDKVLVAITEQPELATLVKGSVSIHTTLHDSETYDGWGASGSATYSSDLAKKQKSLEAKVAKFMSSTKTLQKLTLRISRRRQDQGPASFTLLSSPLHDALRSSTLTHFSTDHLVVFADLEALLLSLSSLSALFRTAGLDSVDGRDDVVEQDHCARLKHLRIGKSSGRVGPRQLNWLLRPSVGDLQKLEIQLTTSTVPGADNDGWGGGGAWAMPHALASAAFADLLVAVGPTLHVLELGTSGAAIISDTLSPDFMLEPHLGSLNYALSQLTSLVSVCLPWSMTSAGFLEVMTGSPNLTKLKMVGNPTQTSARDIINRIEAGSFPRLERLRLEMFEQSSVYTTWNTRDMRALRICMEKHDIELAIQSSRGDML